MRTLQQFVTGNIKGVILDIDGVLRRGREPISGSIEAVKHLSEAGIGICLLTNNSTKTREEISGEIEKMGFPRLPVINSGYASAVYISVNHGPSRILVVGELGLMEELKLEGHDPVMAGSSDRFDLLDLEGSVDPSIDIVLAGMDRSISYRKIADALLHIRNGAVFIATNSDPTFPMENGLVLPGAGSTIAPIIASTGVDPIVIGKPDPLGTRLSISLMGMEPDDVLVVGDRPDTDIEAGSRAGCRIMRVLTGEIGPLRETTVPEYPDLLSLVTDIL